MATSIMERSGTPGAVTEERTGEPSRIVLEFLMNALRLVDGFDIECFEQRTGQSRAAIDAGVADAVRRGWLHDSGTRLVPTPRGLEVLNSMLLLF